MSARVLARAVIVITNLIEPSIIAIQVILTLLQSLPGILTRTDRCPVLLLACTYLS